MIAKVVRGYRPGGLLRYLFGPGTFEEHENPRVVASWDGAPWLRQPKPLASVELEGEILEPGEFDLDLAELTTTMQQPAEDAKLPLTNPPRITPEWAAHLRAGLPLPPGAPSWLHYYHYDTKKKAVVLRPGYVWHCPVRLHPDDPVLTDEQWADIAARLMRATGIHQAGCRWIAVRHADDHIHLMATLVTADGRRFHPRFDHLALRRECRRLERELGLVATAAPDKTAQITPTRQEKAKAARAGHAVTAREELRRVVSGCAAAATGPEEFLRALRLEGLDPRTRVDEDGRVCGYTVALPRDLTGEGQRVRFSGARLGRDLSWPRLRHRWSALTETPTAGAPSTRADRGGRLSPAAERRAVLQRAAEVVDAAAERVRTGEDVDGIAHATGEMLAVLGRGCEGRDAGPWTLLADRYDRAARTPERVVPPRWGWLARELRWTSRRIAALGALSGRGREKAALAALALALAGLITEIAEWQQSRQRLHQAAAAHTAAVVLRGQLSVAAGHAPKRTYVAPVRGSRRPPQRPVMPSWEHDARRGRRYGSP